MKITETELLEALATALQPTSKAAANAWTMNELVAATGCSSKTIARALNRLKVDGRLVMERVTRQDLMGRSSPVPAYRILSTKRKAA